MTEILAAIGGLALMALFVAGALWYFRRIRSGRAGPLIDPSWPTNMRPASPPPSLDRTGSSERDQHGPSQ